MCAIMWYYSFQNQQAGPVDEEAIRSLVAEQKINASTLVWTQGMPVWQPVSSTPLAGLLNPALSTTAAISSQPSAQVYGVQIKTPDQEIKELNDLFMWYWICLIGTIVTFGLSAIASLVLYYIILYRSWQLIQDGYARTTPGKAVGFMFIPFYNFYWIFQAIPGLVKDSNAYIQRYSLPIKQQDPGLAMTFAILTLCCVIPYLNYAIAIALLVLQIILCKNFRDNSIALIRARKQ